MVSVTFCPFDGIAFGRALVCVHCGADRRTLALQLLHNDHAPVAAVSKDNGFAAANESITLHSATGYATQLHKQPWRKLLYVRQDYPDNYVDASFLDELQKNANIRTYEYIPTVLESCAVTQHLSSIAVFLAVFMYLYQGELAPTTLLLVGGVVTGLGYLVWNFSIQRLTPDFGFTRKSIAKGAVVFLITLLGLSPILKTLTEDTSSDTIWALTCCCFVGNMLFHDYSISMVERLNPGSFSLNAAILACVLLASRLPSNLHVFCLMSMGVEWFALFPIFRRYLKALSVENDVIVTVILVALSVILTWNISRTGTILYVLSILFITFVCPLWLIWIQRYKNEIHGPWDEATIRLRSS